jgi:hypothetical protein
MAGTKSVFHDKGMYLPRPTFARLVSAQVFLNLCKNLLLPSNFAETIVLERLICGEGNKGFEKRLIKVNMKRQWDDYKNRVSSVIKYRSIYESIYCFLCEI